MPYNVYLPILGCLIAGMLAAIQAPTNAMLVRPVNSVIGAALISFAVGTFALAVLALALKIKPNLPELGRLPPYAWLGGLYGAFFVSIAAFSAPRLGAASVVTLMIAGQLVASVTIDHFGAFGLPQRAFTVQRLVGMLLVLGGVLLFRRP
jgi:bacterial/archaeal transporter family-2 protein